MAQKAKVAVIGIGTTKCARYPQHGLDVDVLEAARLAIADAGLLPSDIDGITSFPLAPYNNAGNVDGKDFITPSWLAARLDLDPSWMEVNTWFIGSSFAEAVNAVAGGGCKYALVYRALTYPVRQRYGQMAIERAPGDFQFVYPYGFSGPGPASRALQYQRYMHLFGATRQEMSTYAVNNRKMALMNPYGFWASYRPEALSVDDYMTCRMVSDPLCLYDCDIPVQGAAAYVLTSVERAKDAPHRPAYVIGYGLGFASGVGRNSVAMTFEDLLQGGIAASERAWRSTGLQPKDIATANVYDGFTFYVYIWLECLGFCPVGDAHTWIQGGRIELGGELPLNTSGGNQGEGRLHGAAHISEAIRQAMGLAGPRQVAGARYTLAATAPPAQGQVIIFSSEPD